MLGCSAQVSGANQSWTEPSETVRKINVSSVCLFQSHIWSQPQKKNLANTDSRWFCFRNTLWNVCIFEFKFSSVVFAVHVLNVPMHCNYFYLKSFCFILKHQLS
jgi:hypothetical protein